MGVVREGGLASQGGKERPLRGRVDIILGVQAPLGRETPDADHLAVWCLLVSP